MLVCHHQLIGISPKRVFGTASRQYHGGDGVYLIGRRRRPSATACDSRALVCSPRRLPETAAVLGGAVLTGVRFGHLWRMGTTRQGADAGGRAAERLRRLSRANVLSSRK
jgi:hypothetical protein